MQQQKEARGASVRPSRAHSSSRAECEAPLVIPSGGAKLEAPSVIPSGGAKLEAPSVIPSGGAKRRSRGISSVPSRGDSLRVHTKAPSLAHRALCVFMSVVLAVGLMPLPALGQVTPAQVPDIAAPAVDEAAETAEDAGIDIPADVAEMDFSTQRIIVSLESGSIDDRDLDNVVSASDGTYLLQYKNEEAAEKAYVRYDGRDGVEFVAPDIVLEAAGDSLGSEEESTDPTDAPVAEIGSDVSADGEGDASGFTVAIVDTGAPEGDEHVAAYYSSLSSGELYDDSASKHGTSMLYTMAAEDSDVQVISVKALDSAGRGTAATVSEGIGIAVEQGADIVNLSFSGRSTKSNKAIAAAVDAAEAAGVTVIVAAGNDGSDAALYTPANADGAFAVGAACEDGSRQGFSNYGGYVDAYVKAASTSRAAARTSGWLSNYLDEGGSLSAWADELRTSEIAGEWVAEDVSERTDAAGGSGEVKAAASATLVYVYGGGVANGGASKTPAVIKGMKLPAPSEDKPFTGTWVFAGEEDDFAETGKTYPSGTKISDITSVVDGGTYTFYAVWRNGVTFNYKNGDPDDSYNRFYIDKNDGEGTKVGHMSASVPTSESAPHSDGFEFQGWSASGAPGDSKDATAIANEGGVTQYYEMCSRSIPVRLGAKLGDGNIVQSFVMHYYDGAASPQYSIDTEYTGSDGKSAPLKGFTGAGYVPSEDWTLAGFNVNSTDNAKPPFSSVSDLETNAGNVSVDSLAVINAVYQRTLTVNRYTDSSKAKLKDKLEPTQYYSVRNTAIGTGTNVSTPDITLSDPGDWANDHLEFKDEWVYGTQHIAVDSVLKPKDLNLSEAWNDGKSISVDLYAVTEKTEDTYTIEYYDGDSSTYAKKTDAVVGTPTTVNTDYAPTRSGWTFDHWVKKSDHSTTVTTVNEAKDVVTQVEAIYKRDVTLRTGQTGSDTLTQYWNPTEDTYSLTIENAKLAELDGWTKVGWTVSTSTPSASSVPAYAGTDATTGTSGDWTRTATGWTYTGSSNALYAVYTRDVSLTYERDYPTGKTDSDLTGDWPTATPATQYYRASATAPSPSSVSFTLATGLSLSGYNFNGWSETAGGSAVNNSYSKARGVTASGSLTLHALWTEIPNYYTVEFVDGSNTVATKKGYPGTTFSDWPANPSDSTVGTFAYWALPSSPLVQATNVGDGAQVGDTITLQAVWHRDATINTGANTATTKPGAQLYNRSTSSPTASLEIAEADLVDLANWTTTIGWTTSTGTPSASTVSGAQLKSASAGTTSGEWARTSSGWTYTGTSTAIYAVYSRSVQLNYDVSTLESSVTGITNNPDSATQYVRSGGNPTKVSFTLATPAATNYIFNGWTETRDGEDTASSPYEKTPAVGVASPSYTIYDSWTKISSGTETASYRVRHYKQDVDGNYSTYPSDPYSDVTVPNAIVDQAVSGINSASPDAGFVFDSSTPATEKVKKDNSTTFDIKYKRAVYKVSVPDADAGSSKVSFNVSSTYNSVHGAVNDTGASGNATAAFGTTVTITPVSVPSDYEVTGYTVSGGRTTPTVSVDANGVGTFVMPAEQVTGTGITVGALLAKKSTTTASYTVEHYQQRVGGGYPAEAYETKTIQNVTIGTTITGGNAAETYEGFVSPTKSIPETDDVEADGSTTFRLEYERAVYKVTVPNADAGTTDVSFNVSSRYYSEHGATNGTGRSGNATAAFEDIVTITPGTIPNGWKVAGYTVSGGTTTPNVSVDANGVGTFQMPAEATKGVGITVEAVMQSTSTNTGSYTVSHFQKDVDGNYSTYPDNPYSTKTVSGITLGAVVTGSEASSPEVGFEYDECDPAAGVTVVSGSTPTLNIKYKRSVYKVTVPNADTDSTSGQVAFNVSSVNYDKHGATNATGTSGNATAAFEDIVTITPGSVPTGWKVTGYTVGGGRTTPTVSVNSSGVGTFTMPAESTTGAGVTVTATMSQTSVDTASYTVSHLLQNLDAEYPATDENPDAYDNVQKGQTITGASMAKEVAGFTYKDSSPASIVTGTDSELKLRYDRNVYEMSVWSTADVTFSVSSEHSGKFAAAHDSSESAGVISAAYGDTVTIKPDNLPDELKVLSYLVTASTYTSVDVQADGTGTFTMPAPLLGAPGVIVMARLGTKTTTGEYTVGHYQQQLDGTTYELVAGDNQKQNGRYGDPGTGTARNYDGFVFNADKSVYGTVTEGLDDSADPTVKLKYDRLSYAVSAPAVSDEYSEVSFNVTGEHAEALGTEAGMVAYGDTATITPVGLPKGYGVEYALTGAPEGTEVTVDPTTFVATFTMPVATSGVTVTATLIPDATLHKLTITTPHVGVTVAGGTSTVPERVREGTLVILTASPEDGYGIAEDATWSLTGATALGSTSEALVFFMGTSDVTVTAPQAYKELVEKAADGTSVTTTTTFDGNVERSTIVAKDKDGNVTGTASATTEPTSTGSLTTFKDGSGNVTGYEETTTDDQGTVTVTRKDKDGVVTGSTETDTVSLGGGKTRSTVVEKDATGAETSREVVTSIEVAGVTATTAVKSEAGTPVTTGAGTLGEPTKTTVLTGETTTESVTISDGALTSVTTQAPVSKTVKTETTYPVKREGSDYEDWTRVDTYDPFVSEEESKTPSSTEYYRAWMKEVTGSDENPEESPVSKLENPGKYKVDYGSDDTDVASAQATIVEATDADGDEGDRIATVNASAITPKGGAAEAGESTMRFNGKSVSSLTATTKGGVTFSLTRKARAALDAEKYRYVLIVSEDEDMSPTAESVLKSEFSGSHETRAYNVSLYRIATGKGDEPAGAVSEMSEDEAAAFGVTLSLGTEAGGLAAQAARIDASARTLSSVNTSLRADLGSTYKVGGDGSLVLPSVGGTGELLIGLGTVRLVTYASNWPSTVAAIKTESYSLIRSRSTDEVTVVETSPIELSGRSVETWNTTPGGSGDSYKPGTKLGVLSDDLTLYAQWKWNLSTPLIEDESLPAGYYGTQVALAFPTGSTSAEGRADAVVYNGNSQAPTPTVTVNDGTLSSDKTLVAGTDYTVSYEKQAVFGPTTDTTFQVGTTYYTLSNGVYEQATSVTAGAAVTGTYYVVSGQYTRTTDTTFQAGTTYYTLGADGTYTEQTVKTRDAVPADIAYYVKAWSPVTASSVRNAGTYRVVATAIAGEDGIATGAAASGTKATKDFEIDKAAQTLKLPETSITKTFGDGAFTLSAPTVTGSVATDSTVGSVTYAITSNTPNGGANKVSGTAVVEVTAAGQVTVKRAGTAVITAMAAPTENYASANEGISVTINRATRTINATATWKKYVGAAKWNLGAKLTAGATEGTMTYKPANTRIAVTTAGVANVRPSAGGGECGITITAAQTANYKKATKAVKVYINKVAATGKTVTASFANLKKGTVTANTPFNVSYYKSGGTLSYAKQSGTAACVSKIDAKTGKVTIKKGTKKGIYKVKVKVTLSGKGNYVKTTTAVVTGNVKVV